MAIELLVIAWVRKRFLRVSLSQSLIQVTLGGATVAAVGFALGHAWPASAGRGRGRVAAVRGRAVP